jgi:glyoxylase-like metal-dependent hydrolase (beta-lactamase superfamily II)
MRLGSAELSVLSDGEWRLDGGSIFGVVPRTLWEKVLPPDELNRVPMALNCLLILSQGKRILVDTGYGRKLSPKERRIRALRHDHGDLLDNLERLGHTPADIDIVINTHLHPDHCGGNTIVHDGVPVPTFPNAQYWIQRLEWAAACYPNERTRSTYLAESFSPLEKAGQLQLLLGDTPVTEEVRCVVTRGHTQAHQSVIIESDGETAVFLGDLAARAVHLERLTWTTAYDSEPLETLEAKRAMRDWALQRHALLIFGHDVSTPTGFLEKEGDRFRVKAA